MKPNSNTLGNPSEELRNEYFFWLCDRIERRQDKDGSRELAGLLHSIEFKSLVPRDDNRAEDGITLRERFYQDVEIPFGNQISGPCSVLEMLIALSCRIDSVLTENPEHYSTQKWFWEMVDNLNLHAYADARNRRIIDNFINRRYGPDGKGGLFPLKKPQHDQRNVELWYQFMSYADENYPE